jgi:HEAT repeat protein
MNLEVEFFSLSIRAIRIAPVAVWLACLAVCPGQDYKANGFMWATPPAIGRDLIPGDMPTDVRKEVERLYGDDATVTLAAVNALAAMGPRAAPAAPFLAGMLEGHFGEDIPNAAGHALIKIGKGAVDSVNMALSATGSEGRRRAAYIVGRIGDERSIEPLLDSFAARLGNMPQLGALRSIGDPARQHVFSALKSGNPGTRQAAVRAIVAFSTIGIGHRFLANDGGGGIPVPAGWRSQPVVDALLGALADENRDVRIAALESLATVASSCEDAAVPLSEPLRAVLRDQDKDVRLGALRVAALTRSDDRIGVLAEATADPEPSVREQSFKQLALFKDDRALDLIAKATNSTDPRIRHLAVRTLASSTQPRFVPLLTALLDSSDANTRKDAMVGLGKLRATNIEERLLKMLDDPAAPVRIAALLAIGRCGGKNGAEALIRLAKSKDPTIRYESAWALSERYMDRLGPNRLPPSDDRSGLLPLPDSSQDAFPYVAVRAFMLDLLEGPYSDLHSVAVTLIFAEQNQRGVSDRELIAALNSPEGSGVRSALEYMRRSRAVPDKRFLEPLRRVAALDLLAKMGDTETVLRHCAAMMSNDSSHVGCTAVGILNQLGDAGLDMLLRHLGDPREDVRSQVASALASRMDNPLVNKSVRAGAGSADPNLRSGALQIVSPAQNANVSPELFAKSIRSNILDPEDPNRRKLVKMGAAATPVLLALLKDGNADVRAAAAAILGETGDRSAVPALVAALDDKAASVRARAVETLGRLGDRQTAATLVKAAGDRDPAVGEVALTALSTLNAPAATEALIGAMSSNDWRLRRAAAEELGRRANDRAAAPLIRAVEKDPHWSVRRAAADSLGRTGNIACAPALIAALRDDHWFVRYAAHQSLQALAGREPAADPDAWRAWWEQNRKTTPTQ